MPSQSGGCLCGKVRYLVTSEPTHVTICHCKFCQRATGAAYLVEPIFKRSSFEITTGVPKVYSAVSAGSGNRVDAHFCADCGTKLYLGFEKAAELVGIYGGTFDDPNWFERTPENARHIFMSSAQKGTIIPAGYKVFHDHVITKDGSPREPVIFETPQTIG
jgi:hypothetical protein